MLTPFDTLIDAIVHCSGYRNPTSPVYKARNPGALKAYSPSVPRDEEGNRIFKSEIDGLQALKFDVRTKIDGKSKLKCATIAELAEAYNFPSVAKPWVNFIRQALCDSSVNTKTPLTFFSENK